MGRVSTEVGTVLLGQERGRPWPPGVSTILCYSALGVLVQEVVLAELTGAILKQYLVTESIPELPKVVLNLARFDCRSPRANEQGRCKGFLPVSACFLPCSSPVREKVPQVSSEQGLPQGMGIRLA